MEEGTFIYKETSNRALIVWNGEKWCLRDWEMENSTLMSSVQV